MDIAFLGMGLMGAPMALNCLRAGHRVAVWNRTASKCEPLRAAGAQVAATPAEAARGRAAVLLCLEDTAAVESVLFGEQGVAAGLMRKSSADGKRMTGGGAGPTSDATLVIDHSTIAAEAEAGFATRLRELCGAQLLDAPVTGGDVGAKAGTLSILVGGPVAAVERAQPLLQAMGKKITHIGERIGDGQRAKMVNQLVCAVNLVATLEGMRLGETLGLNMERVLEAIGGGAAGSWSLSNFGPKWLARDFAPGFRIKHMLKDLNFCSDALAAGVKGTESAQFPGLRLVQGLFDDAVRAGLGELGTQALEKPLDKTGKA